MTSLAKTFVLAAGVLGLSALAGCGSDNSAWPPGVTPGTMITFSAPWDEMRGGTIQRLYIKLTKTVSQKAYVVAQIDEAYSQTISTSWQGTASAYAIVAAGSDSTDMDISAKPVTAELQVTMKFLLRDTPEFQPFNFKVKP